MRFGTICTIWYQVLLGPFGMVPNASRTIWYGTKFVPAAPQRIGMVPNVIAAKIEHLVFGTIPNTNNIWSFGTLVIGQKQCCIGVLSIANQILQYQI